MSSTASTSSQGEPCTDPRSYSGRSSYDDVPTISDKKGNIPRSPTGSLVANDHPSNNEPVQSHRDDDQGNVEVEPPTRQATPTIAVRDAAAILLAKEGKHDSKPCSVRRVLRTIALIVVMLTALYCFLLGLGLMGTSFKVLAGKSAGNLFAAVDHPLSGLMVGIMATVLLQSSSTSTSIVVGLVGSGVMPVAQAVYIIMGANIGTSVTNTIVALGQVTQPLEYERAFGGATIHDIFNFLSVLVLLPLEWLVGGIEGEGGPIYWIAKELTMAMLGSASGTFTSPTKVIVSPIVKLFLAVDKKKLKALAFGKPELDTCLWKNPPINSKPLVVAKINFTICGHGGVFNQSTAAWDNEIVHGDLVKGGWFQDTSDGVAGGVCLFLSLVILCTALFVLVWALKKLLLGSAMRIVTKAALLPGILALLIGAALTILVQSSSITTSALTPLVGIGVLPLEKMLPLTLGANLGTTSTALLAALVVATGPALQIALCHLFFNVIGIFIWYPLPVTREIVLSGARWLGKLACAYRFAPLIYLLMAFFLLPLLLLAMSLLAASDTLGLEILGWFLIASTFLAVIITIVVAWKKGGLIKLRDHLNTRRDANLEAFLAAREAEEQREEGNKQTSAAESEEENSTAVVEMQTEPTAIEHVNHESTPTTATHTPTWKHS